MLQETSALYAPLLFRQVRREPQQKVRVKVYKVTSKRLGDQKHISKVHPQNKLFNSLVFIWTQNPSFGLSRKMFYNLFLVLQTLQVHHVETNKKRSSRVVNLPPPCCEARITTLSALPLATRGLKKLQMLGCWKVVFNMVHLCWTTIVKSHWY